MGLLTVENSLVEGSLVTVEGSLVTVEGPLVTEVEDSLQGALVTAGMLVGLWNIVVEVAVGSSAAGVSGK